MKELFKNVYQLSIEVFGELSDTKAHFDITKPHHLHLIELSIRNIQILFQGSSIEDFLLLESAFLKDIILLRSHEKSREGIDAINYLQLSFFTTSAGLFNMRGLFSYSYDSIILSVGDSKIGNGDTFTIEHDRLFGILESKNIFIKIEAEGLIVTWLSGLYYYSFSVGGFVKFCEDFFDKALILAVSENDFDSDKLQLLSNLNVWKSHYDREELDIADFLLKQFKKLKWDNELKPRIGDMIISFKIIPKTKREEIFKELTGNTSLRQHLELQHNASLTENVDDFDNRYERIIEAAKKYNQDLKLVTKDQLLLIYERSRIFKTIIKLVLLAAKSYRTKELTNILGAYYDIEEELSDSILYIIPGNEDGIYYAWNDRIERNIQDTKSLTKEVIDIYNKLFNRTISLIGSKSEILKPVREMGVTSETHASNFEKAATEFFSFDLVDCESITDVSGMVTLGFHTFPIQTLMLKQIGCTLPIISSFSKTKKQRKVEKVLIWATGSYSSIFEESAIIEICKANGIKYDVISDKYKSKNRFIELYNSDEYSVIWVISHGEHKNYEAHKSIINITNDKEVTTVDLELKLQSDENRLLVLNLCESGINLEHMGFRSIGFTHQLANSQQSVISHLWVVNPIAAMTFGVLLAIRLLKTKMSYFEAYSDAVLKMIEGKSAIIKELNEEVYETVDLINRVENSSIDWESILQWGSSAFFK